VRWVTVTPELLTVAPGEMAGFRLAIQVPTESSAGATGILDVTMSNQLASTTGMHTALGGSLGVQLLIRSKNATPRVDVDIVRVTPPTSSTKLNVLMRLRNSGATYVRAEPAVDLVGPFGDFIGYTVPEQTSWLLLPQEAKELNLEWAGNLAPSSYQAIASVVAGGDQVAISQEQFDVREQDDTRVVAPPRKGKNLRGLLKSKRKR
jgi:hypothetical protein